MEKKEIRRFRQLARQFQRVTGGLLQDDRCCGGLTLAQCHVLLEIEGRSRVTLTELAAGLGLDKSTLSRTVDALVARDLVMRIPCPSDRRCNLHAATERGGEALESIHRTSDEQVRITFSRIPAAQRKRVIDSLEVLVRAMAEASKNCCTAPAPGGKEQEERMRNRSTYDYDVSSDGARGRGSDGSLAENLETEGRNGP